MKSEDRPVVMSGAMLTVMVMVNAIILVQGLVKGDQWYNALLISVPMLILTLIDVYREKNHH